LPGEPARWWVPAIAKEREFRSVLAAKEFDAASAAHVDDIDGKFAPAHRRWTQAKLLKSVGANYDVSRSQIFKAGSARAVSASTAALIRQGIFPRST
jgi:hypothetical protein